MDLISDNRSFSKNKRKADVFKGFQGLFHFLSCYKDRAGKENMERVLRRKRKSKPFLLVVLFSCLYISRTSSTLLFLEVIFFWSLRRITSPILSVEMISQCGTAIWKQRPSISSQQRNADQGWRQRRLASLSFAGGNAEAVGGRETAAISPSLQFVTRDRIDPG